MPSYDVPEERVLHSVRSARGRGRQAVRPGRIHSTRPTNKGESGTDKEDGSGGDPEGLFGQVNVLGSHGEFGAMRGKPKELRRGRTTSSSLLAAQDRAALLLMYYLAQIMEGNALEPISRCAVASLHFSAVLIN